MRLGGIFGLLAVVATLVAVPAAAGDQAMATKVTNLLIEAAALQNQSRYQEAMAPAQEALRLAETAEDADPSLVARSELCGNLGDDGLRKAAYRGG